MDDDEPILLHEQDLMLAWLHAASEQPAELSDAFQRLSRCRRRANEPPPRETPQLVRRMKRARLALVKAGALQRDEGEAVKTTALGRDLLANEPTGVDESYLMRFPDFRQFIEEEAQRVSPDDPREAAFAAGLQAHATGRSHIENPFPFDSVDHLAWENGWFDARNEVRTQKG